MPKLAAGDAAPSFSLIDQHGRTVRLEDFRGRKLLVYFYPEADTPGCTTQSCDVRDHLHAFSGLGVDVVGISPDVPEDQLAFDEKFSLGFPLLADTDHAVAEAWGAWGEKNLYGNVSFGLIRSSFLVEEDGTIKKTWYRVPAAETVSRAMKALAPADPA
jgi:thioredoxin-dependent peroxiredoxin